MSYKFKDVMDWCIQSNNLIENLQLWYNENNRIYYENRYIVMPVNSELWLDLSNTQAILNIINSYCHSLNEFPTNFPINYTLGQMYEQIFNIIKHNFILLVAEIRALYVSQQLDHGKYITENKYNPIDNTNENYNSYLTELCGISYNLYDTLSKQATNFDRLESSLSNIYREFEQIIDEYGILKIDAIR